MYGAMGLPALTSIKPNRAVWRAELRRAWSAGATILKAKPATSPGLAPWALSRRSGQRP